MVAHALSTFNNITEPSCLQECGMASQLTHKFFHVTFGLLSDIAIKVEGEAVFPTFQELSVTVI